MMKKSSMTCMHEGRMNMIKRGVGGVIMLSWTSDAVVIILIIIMNGINHSGPEVLRLAVRTLSRVAFLISLVM